MSDRPYFHEGLIRGRTPGRADKVHIQVIDGSYVVPADCVSGLGDGNTEAGASRLHTLFVVEGDLPQPIVVVDVKVAAGEWVCRPDRLIIKFKGTLAEALDRMDEWVIEQRREHIKALTELPPPQHSKIIEAPVAEG